MKAKKMFNGNILVREKENTNQTASGLFIAAPIAKNYREVTVIQPDNENTVEEGDVMFVGVSSGTPLELEGEEITVVNIRDIILIL